MRPTRLLGSYRTEGGVRLQGGESWPVVAARCAMACASSCWISPGATTVCPPPPGARPFARPLQLRRVRTARESGPPGCAGARCVNPGSRALREVRPAARRGHSAPLHLFWGPARCRSTSPRVHIPDGSSAVGPSELPRVTVCGRSPRATAASAAVAGAHGQSTVPGPAVPVTSPADERVAATAANLPAPAARVGLRTPGPSWFGGASLAAHGSA